MINNHEFKKELSTSALAKELNKNSQEIFQQLCDMGLIIRNGDSWDLKAEGTSKGGVYREHEKYGRCIVWPESIKAEFEERLPELGHLLTSTNIGKQFEISATRTNSILSESGLIEKGVKGWVVTELGKKLGGIQSQDKVSGIPYVCWPGNSYLQKTDIFPEQMTLPDASVWVSRGRRLPETPRAAGN